MTGRKKPTVTVDVGKWTATVSGPVSVAVAAVRQAVGGNMSFEPHGRILRVNASNAADVIAALESAGARVQVKGEVPQPVLPW